MHQPRISPETANRPARPSLTDSLWFWFALFSAVGLAALLATGGKFGKRQSNIEQKYQARQWAAEQGMGPGFDRQLETATNNNQPQDFPTYSQPSETLIRLGPLAVTVGLVLLLSLVMLGRDRLKRPSDFVSPEESR